MLLLIFLLSASPSSHPPAPFTSKCLWTADPCHPGPHLRHIPSRSWCQIGQPLTCTSPADPLPAHNPPSPVPSPGLPVCSRCSVLYTLQCTVGWWQAIWDLPTAAVPVSSSAAFRGRQKALSPPLSFFYPLPYSPHPSTHPPTSTRTSLLLIPSS